MSIEITLYTKKATKSRLIKYLRDHDFYKVKHFIDSFNDENNLHYMWFGSKNNESTAGVESTIIKVDNDLKKQFKCSDWILHTRTKYNGSFEDKAKQNEIIKSARKQFGGTFYNDGYGTNRYIDLNDYPRFQPHEKAISNIRENALEKLFQITNSVENYENPLSDHLQSINIPALKDLLKTKDPSVTLYNSLIPFLVSVIEYFFGEIFIAIIRYDPVAKELIAKENFKIGISEVMKIENKVKSIEESVAENYNFQNLDSINKVYNKFVQIDIFSILSKRKKVNGKILRILNKLEDLINSRHNIIHNLEFNYEMTKNDYLAYVKTVEKMIEIIVDELENQRKLNIER